MTAWEFTAAVCGVDAGAIGVGLVLGRWLSLFLDRR